MYVWIKNKKLLFILVFIDIQHWSARNTLANLHRKLPARYEKVPSQRGLARRARCQTTPQNASQHSLVHQLDYRGASLASPHRQDPASQEPLVLRSQLGRQIRSLLSNQLDHDSNLIMSHPTRNFNNSTATTTTILLLII